MDESWRRTRTIYDAFTALMDQGAIHMRPSDIATHLRNDNQPLDAWQIYGQFRILERMGLIYVEPETGFWYLIEGQDFNSAQQTG